MATKKTTKKEAAPAKAKPAKKTTTTAKKAPKGEASAAAKAPRHPKGRVTALHQGKEALAKALASSLAFGDESADSVAGRLKTASNTQLLRLQRVVETVKQKWGSRDKLIQAITDSSKSGKDKDYVAKLGTFSLPRLVDLATSAQRRARA